MTTGDDYGDGHGYGSGYEDGHGYGDGYGYGGGDGDGYGDGDDGGGGNGKGIKADNTIIHLDLDRFEQGLLCPNPQDLRALVINRIIVLGSSSHPKSALHSVQV